MKRFKRLAGLALTLLLMMLLLPSAFAAELPEGAAWIPGSDSTVWYMLNDTELTVGGSGSIPAYTTTTVKDAPWYGKVTSLVVEDGVTGIGSNAFYGCKTLTSVKLPASVRQIGASAFSGTKVAKLDISDLSSWLSTELANAAANPANDSKTTTAVTVAGAALSDLSLPEEVTAIPAHAFSGWNTVGTVTIPAAIKSIGASAFSNTKVTRLNIGNLTSWFAVALENADANPACASSTLTDIFIGGQQITALSLPEGLVNIPAYAFCGWNTVNTFTIPSSLKSIGASAFYNTKVTQLNIRDLASWCAVTLADSASNPANNLKVKTNIAIGGEAVTELSVPAGVPMVSDYVFYGWNTILTARISSGVLRIGEGAFSNCTALESVSLGSVKTIEKKAFSDCTALTEVVIPDSVSSFGNYVFEKCSALRHVTIGNIDSIGMYAFYWCQALTTAEIGAETIGDYAFEQCIALSDLTMSRVRSIGTSSFSYCKALTDLVIPESVESIGATAFAYCSSLRSVTVNETGSIGTNAFKNCTALTDVTLGSVGSVGNTAFSGCKVLDTVVMDDVNGIGTNLFQSCKALRAIVVPDGKVSAYKSVDSLASVQDKIVPAYFVRIPDDRDGTLTADKRYVLASAETEEEKTVSLRINTENGYAVSGVSVTDAAGTPIPVSEDLRFVVNGSEVTVTAEFTDIHIKGTEHAEKAPTCTAAGNVHYFECRNCGAALDENDNVLSDVTVPPMGHDFSGEAKGYGFGVHSYRCVNGCGQIGNTESCTDSDGDGRCDICGSSNFIGSQLAKVIDISGITDTIRQITQNLFLDKFFRLFRDWGFFDILFGWLS